MDFSYMLLTSLPVESKLIASGFTKEGSSWKLKKDIDSTDFYAKFNLSSDNFVAEVFEKDTDEKYVIVDVPSSHGRFVTEIRQKVAAMISSIQAECFETFDLREKYVEYIKTEFGVEPDFPWGDKTDYAVFRNKSDKWFALIMKIKFRSLGLKSDEEVFVVNLKADDDKIPQITDRKSVFPAYHMNKKYWITVLLTSVTDFDNLCRLTERSYELVSESNGKGKK